jgi:hypothetical protein
MSTEVAAVLRSMLAKQMGACPSPLFWLVFGRATIEEAADLDRVFES